ncbi:MAG TPA: thiamine-phosphate kinase [Terriglobales bacterium]|nr:thiamine-phosphate kinase [Terriglobales bacterium]
MIGEDDLVRRIRAAAAADRDGVIVGIGDDCAVLVTTPGTQLIAKTDLLIEDVHFRRHYATPADVGWKALAVNVSDLSAKGARSRWALVALACPGTTTPDEVDAFYEGLLALAREHGVAVVGGDTSSSPGGWFVNVSLLGEASRAVLRSTARVGDVVAVTGTLGRSAAGLALLERGAAPRGLDGGVVAAVTAAHLRPRPRVAEGRWLGAAEGVTAMMDLSDGLAIDLPRLCVESAVGAQVELDALPIAPGTREVAGAVERDALAWATGGGEDYELLLTCAPAAFARLAAGLADVTGTPLTRVGTITARSGVTFVDGDGRPVEVARGYEHFAAGR